jgi:hypothetical protein
MYVHPVPPWTLKLPSGLGAFRKSLMQVSISCPAMWGMREPNRCVRGHPNCAGTHVEATAYHPLFFHFCSSRDDAHNCRVVDVVGFGDRGQSLTIYLAPTDDLPLLSDLA